jgi:hypothetical protein
VWYTARTQGPQSARLVRSATGPGRPLIRSEHRRRTTSVLLDDAGSPPTVAVTVVRVAGGRVTEVDLRRP